MEQLQLGDVRHLSALKGEGMKEKLLVTMLAAATILAGCGGNGEAAVGRVDTTDPLDVATAFFNSVDAGNLDAAIIFVLPEQAADFREAMSGGMPRMPSDYEVMVMAQGDEAEASITGADMEVDMVLVDGRWWICL